MPPLQAGVDNFIIKTLFNILVNCLSVHVYKLKRAPGVPAPLSELIPTVAAASFRLESPGKTAEPSTTRSRRASR